MSPTIEYWTNEPDDVYPTELVVSAAGAALVVSSNDDDPDLTTFGFFWLANDGTSFEPLLRAVEAPEFAIGPAPGLTEPGSLVRRLTVRDDGQPELTRWALEQHVPDASFTRAEDAALQLVRQVRRHPRRALSLDALTLTPGPADDPNARLDVAVALRNPGPEPVAIPAPGRWRETAVQLTLTIRRSDVPLAQMGNQHQVFLHLGADALAPLGLSAGRSEYILLSPGQSLSLTFHAAMPILAPGAYDAWGTFQLVLLDAQGAELLRGELSSPRRPLHPS